MEAAKYEYTLMIEDDENLKRVGFGKASNEFFKQSSSVIQPGPTSAGISHSWTPSDNNGQFQKKIRILIFEKLKKFFEKFKTIF